jgi:1,4-alpha-glucan branching enzyme
LRRFNQEAYRLHPDVQVIAEESTSWPAVSRPIYAGGLGFGLKWDMGWMHDTLEYMRHDPVHRRFHHGQLTFRMLYAFTENFLLSLSHDEVVHGKGSLISKMPGDDWQKAANLRLLLAYMYAQPGKKLLFMGGEFGQWKEWDHESSLSWEALDSDFHRSLKLCAEDLNRTYSAEPALHVLDCDPSGFEWVDANDSDNSVLTFLRHGHDDAQTILAAFNFTPVPRFEYRVGIGNLGAVESSAEPAHGKAHSLSLTLPPLAGVLLRRVTGAD